LEPKLYLGVEEVGVLSVTELSGGVILPVGCVPSEGVSGAALNQFIGFHDK
jgi:hypothetical protein